MKKSILFISLVILILALAFFFVTKKDIHFNKEANQNEIKEDNTPSYIDDNDTLVGLYKKEEKVRNLIKEYETIFKYHQDLIELEVYYTNETVLNNTNQIKLFDQYRDSYQNAYSYKIGYQINFETKNQVINKTILSPKDTEDFYEFLEVYLYDDYHRNKGEWYSHTTESEYNDETILTSIKLTSGKLVDEIISDIHLTVFTYDEDDFANNTYRGKSKYEVIIKKSNT